jgi:DNA-binding NarL/FixJ family response regulator
MHDSGQTATKALAAGASGLVLKSDAGRDLVRAVQAVDKNEPFLSPAVTKIILGHLAKTQTTGPSPGDLTPREREVVKLLAQGRSNKEVATALEISVKTVDAHRTNLMRKLNLSTYSDLIYFAIRHKIVEI